MIHFFGKALFAFLLCFTCACGGAPDAATRVLRLSGIPDSKGTEIEVLARTVEAFLSAELGMEVEYINATDYDAAVAMIGYF